MKAREWLDQSWSRSAGAKGDLTALAVAAPLNPEQFESSTVPGVKVEGLQGSLNKVVHPSNQSEVHGAVPKWIVG